MANQNLFLFKSPLRGIAYMGAAVLSVLPLAAPKAAAVMPKTYVITGQVVEVKDNQIVVKHGKELLVIAQDDATHILGPVKTGARVRIQYRMAATEIETKAKTKTAGIPGAVEKPEDEGAE